MAKFQELVMKLIESHTKRPLSAARKTILQDRVKQLLSQYQTPDHPPYAAMIERALRELNEKLGSTEDSISKFIEKEYKNLPLAHSTLLKHHLGKLCEYGEIVIRGQKYMLAGSVSSTVHKRKKTKKKKHENKQKRDQKDDMSEDLENNSSKKTLYGDEKPSAEGEGERLVSNDFRESNDSFLSTESPIGMEYNGNKNLEVAKSQQEEDKVEDKNPEISGTMAARYEHLLDNSLEKLDYGEGMKVGPTSKEQPTEPPITSGPLIFGPIKDKSVGPKGSELVSSKEFCESLLNRRPVEPNAEETAFSVQEHKLNRTDEEDLRHQSEKPKKSTLVTYQRAKLRSCKKLNEDQQLNLSKTDEKEVVIVKKRGRRRKTLP